MIKEKLTEKFGTIINHHSCVYLNEGEDMLRYFLQKVKPENVIEIGTYQGVSTAIISEYANVFSFDIREQPLRQEIWNFLELKNITYNLIKNNEEKKEKIIKLLNTESIDLCFIDGKHDGGQPESDFEICKQCKNILFHDYSPAFKEVYDFCNKESILKFYDREIKESFCLLTQKESKEIWKY